MRQKVDKKKKRRQKWGEEFGQFPPNQHAVTDLNVIKDHLGTNAIEGSNILSLSELTITGKGHRLLRVRNLNGHLYGAAGVPPSVLLGDNGTAEVAGVGGRIVVREFGAQAAKKGPKK